jgi:hypothetical protein
MDLLVTNHLGRAMHSSLYDNDPSGQPNFARYTFLDDDSHRFYPDWDTARRDLRGHLAHRSWPRPL